MTSLKGIYNDKFKKPYSVDKFKGTYSDEFKEKHTHDNFKGNTVLSSLQEHAVLKIKSCTKR